MRFEIPADLLRFVTEWLFVYGETKEVDLTKSMIHRWMEQFKEFKEVIREHYFPSSLDVHKNQPSTNEGKCYDKNKIFEILRIRNRFDPELEEVPGGYRDFAIKMNIGFYRQVLSLTANRLIASLPAFMTHA